MPRPELLNNISHKDLRVRSDYSVDLGDNIPSCVTFITEFAEVQKEYPILFRKDRETAEFQAVVLFGFRKNENLFLAAPDSSPQKHRGWNASYVPAAVARGPFMIGYQNQTENGEERKVPVIHVDMDNPKVSQDEGARVFLEQGGNSPYLEQISRMLNLIRDGMNLNRPMFDAFDRYSLIEDVTVDIDLNNGDKHRLNDFYTINADKLMVLDGEVLQKLNRSGFLQAAYFVVASLSNIKRLVDIKNHQW